MISLKPLTDWTQESELNKPRRLRLRKLQSKLRRL